MWIVLVIHKYRELLPICQKNGFKLAMLECGFIASDEFLNMGSVTGRGFLYGCIWAHGGTIATRITNVIGNNVVHQDAVANMIYDYAWLFRLKTSR